MSSENSIDLYRTEPGTLAGHYLRSFWQPVYRAGICQQGKPCCYVS